MRPLSGAASALRFLGVSPLWKNRGLAPNGTHFARKVAGTFHVPSAFLRLTAHGMCLLLSKVSAIGLAPCRSRGLFNTNGGEPNIIQKAASFLPVLRPLERLVLRRSTATRKSPVFNRKRRQASKTVVKQHNLNRPLSLGKCSHRDTNVRRQSTQVVAGEAAFGVDHG